MGRTAPLYKPKKGRPLPSERPHQTSPPKQTVDRLLAGPYV